MFHCDMCGECCRNLGHSPLYQDLHDGDGICRFLAGNMCTVYDMRPLLCRVDDAYDAYFSYTISREEFYRLNEQACTVWKSQSELIP